MAPVLSYARTHRIERNNILDPEGSTHSSDSSESIGTSFKRPRAGSRFRRNSDPSKDHTRSPPPPERESAVPIEDYCLGEPKKVGQSHSGAVELFISLQEKAVFLPSLSRRHRHRRHSRSHRNRRDSANNEGESAVSGADSTYRRYSDTERRSSNDSLHQHTLSTTMEHENEHNEQDNDNDNEFDEDAAPALANDEQPNLHTSSDGGNLDEDSEPMVPCSPLRGSVLLKLSKPTKIKEIGISFYCVSRTLWNLLPQPALFVDSALPNNAQVEDMAYLGIHRWDFVPLEQFGPAQSSYEKLNVGQSSTLIGQDLYGADAAVMKDHPNEVRQRKYSRVYNSQICQVRGHDQCQLPLFSPLNAQPRKLKQNNAQVDGVVFPAGTYIYNFTLLVDAKTPPTVSVPNGQVKFVLGAKVVRTGAFTLNVSGHVEVDVVRAPPEASGATDGCPTSDAILLSRVWEDRFVYMLNLERRNITLDVPTKLSLMLMPLSDPDVRIHQVQIYATESVTYIYSLDQAIRYVDPNLKLLLYQKDAPPKGSLLSATDSTTINANITLVSEHNPSPKQYAIEPYHRGRYGELRFLEPDVRGPYIRVRHRLLLVLRVSRSKEGEAGRNIYEVKIDTPITVLSRHCVTANISLPSYQAGLLDYEGGATFTNTSSEYEDNDDHELPPSFDDAMEHQLLGPPGAPHANPRGTKACFIAKSNA